MSQNTQDSGFMSQMQESGRTIASFSRLFFQYCIKSGELNLSWICPLDDLQIKLSLVCSSDLPSVQENAVNWFITLLNKVP